ncbi:MAG: hypothetical protein E7J25_06570 [Paeniclostridium sordellii]|nr:hypothetical protein [Paeniclostridium sordellii]
MNLNTKDLIICAIFASITAILAQIAIPIPFSTVPYTPIGTWQPPLS